MRGRILVRFLASIVGVAILLAIALILSVVERYLFGSRDLAVALGCLGLLDFAEWLYGVALTIWPAF